MADLSDVLTALGTLIGTALYPSGASGENPSPVAGIPVRVEMGWPSPQSLDSAVIAGKAHVSIYPRPEERNTSRIPEDWQTTVTNPATFTLVQAGQVVTVGGAQPGNYYPQNLAIFANGKPYLVQAANTDTPSSLAAALQALIVVAIPGTTVIGPAITFPNSARIGALRVGATGTSVQEIGRQERAFQITIWADTPAHRDVVAKPVDLALRNVTNLSLADGTAGRMFYRGSPFSDFDQKMGIFRRDLLYVVEYGTTNSETDTAIVEIVENITGTGDGASSPGPTNTFYE